MKSIKELEPALVWNNFHLLTQQPRPSKHEEKVRAFLLEWGKAHGLEAFADKTGNVIIKIPATPGMEKCKGVVLQGHMDMVPQKNSDKVHDFLTDPIETVICGDWVKANGTTLGADNGLGVAMAMALAEDKDSKHGPIEILVTYDEETGMTGAAALESGVLDGDILINLDSESEGEFYVGCAGGLDSCSSATYERKSEPKGYECWSLAVKGCQGGHSGMDIILYRANANKMAARILLQLLTENDVKLIDLEGGTLRNAIPREAFATVYVNKDNVEAAKATVAGAAARIKAEFAGTDPNLEVVFEPYKGCAADAGCKAGSGDVASAEAGCKCTGGEGCDPEDCLYVEETAALRFIRAILACPDGVERMSDSVPGLVETSNNMAMVKIYRGEFFVKCLMRSSVDSSKEALAEKLRAVFDLAGVKSEFSGGYSGWAPNPKSEIVALMKETYNDTFGEEAKVMAIHAGLECGILSGAYPHWDMVSMGPTLLSPHSPDERAYIPSVGKVYDFLKAVLARIPKR